MSSTRALLVTLCLASCACGGKGGRESATVAPAGEHRFASDSLGFAIAKPPGWHFETPQLEQRDHAKNGDETFGALQRKYENAPLVTLLKYEDAATKLNPSVKVTLRPLHELHDKPPKQIAAFVVAGMKQSIPTFQLLEPVAETTIAGHPAGVVQARFSVEDRGSGAKYQVRSRLWLVPRGDQLFIIGMSAPAQGEDNCEPEFAAIRESIEIDALD